MVKEIKIEQLCWGNEGQGYRLLLENSNPVLNNSVSDLCQSIGTLNSSYDGTPFLISSPVQDYLIMICAAPGKDDSYGRKTLFFHALAVKKEDADNFGVNAFSLYLANFFRSGMPEETSPLIIQKPLATPDLPAPGFRWNREKLAIYSEKPENEKFCAILGDRINRCSWTTYAFLQDPRWDIYAIAKDAPLPTDRKCLLFSGELLSAPLEEKQMVKASEASGSVSVSSAGKKLTLLLMILLLFSILGNIFLILKIQKNDKKMNVAVKDFDQTKIIKDLKTESRNTNFELYYKEGALTDYQKEFYSKLEYYINFVNTNILDQKKGK